MKVSFKEFLDILISLVQVLGVLAITGFAGGMGWGIIVETTKLGRSLI